MTINSSDPGFPGKKPGRGKPRIWAEGRQRPVLEVRSFLRVSLTNSRALAIPALLFVARHIDHFGTRIEEGEIRIPAKRLGHTGKFLPSHVTTGRRLCDSAVLTCLAAEAARGETAVEAMTFRSWTEARATPAPIPVAVPVPVITETPPAPVQRPKRPAPLALAPANADEDRDTLEAIRNLMHTSVIEPAHPKRSPKSVPAPPGGVLALPELAPAEPGPRSGLFKLTGKVMGTASVALAFPLGMAQAGYALARGEDPRLAP